jgi:hypothetical protein
MDAKTLAAEMKAKALAAMKEAEEMERAAEQIERLAAKHGWQIDITAKTSSYAFSIKNASPAAPSPQITSGAAPPKKGGKQVDPNSVTSRSKSESVRIIRFLNRPVPLGELGLRLAAEGVRLGGKKPNQALSANLGMCPELVSTKRGWWLKGVPLPPESNSAIGRGEGLPGLNS